jgi:hypothetical protein
MTYFASLDNRTLPAFASGHQHRALARARLHTLGRAVTSLLPRQVLLPLMEYPGCEWVLPVPTPATELYLNADLDCEA